MIANGDDPYLQSVVPGTNGGNFFLGLRNLQSALPIWPYAPAEENQGMSGMARRARSAREGA